MRQIAFIIFCIIRKYTNWLLYTQANSVRAGSHRSTNKTWLQLRGKLTVGRIGFVWYSARWYRRLFLHSGSRAHLARWFPCMCPCVCVWCVCLVRCFLWFELAPVLGTTCLWVLGLAAVLGIDPLLRRPQHPAWRQFGSHLGLYISCTLHQGSDIVFTSTGSLLCLFTLPSLALSLGTELAGGANLGVAETQADSDITF